jgi:signal transduction histidine kinase
MKFKRKIAFVVAIIFLIFLVAFGLLIYTVTNIFSLQDVKYQSSQLLSDMYYLDYVTQSILPTSFKTTEEIRNDLILATNSFENTLSTLEEQSNNKFHTREIEEKLQIASRLWEFTKQDLKVIADHLETLFESGIERRKGPMNSLMYYHSNLNTEELYTNKDHYHILRMENSIDMVLGGAYSYNATLQSLDSAIKDRADTFIRVSLVLSILLIVGFVGAALILVFLFSHQALARQVEKLLSEAVTNVEAKRRAELRALQFQINPHFLYNTLGSIRLVAAKNRDRETADMLLVLSRLLRKTTTRTPTLITVEEELATLEDYISLLQIRYKNRINFDQDIPTEITELLMPSLLFQPLVENAVLHGLSEKLNRPEIGSSDDASPGKDRPTLIISGSTKGKNLFFSVYDNGTGMSDRHIHELFRENGKGNGDGSRSDGHIGIHNIHERIIYNFGNEYGLTVKSKVDEFTKVEIHLPVLLSEGEDGL